MIDEAHKITDERLEALEKRLSSIYDQAVDEIVAKWDEFSAEYQRELKVMKRKLKDGIISEDDFKAWKREKALMNGWYQQMAESLSLDAVNVDRMAVSIINGELPDTYITNANWALYTAEKQAGISTSITLYDRATVLRLIDSRQIFLPMAKLDDIKDLRWNMQHFNSAITQSILQGESIENAAKRLERVLKMDYNNAVRNARTAITAAENIGRMDTMKRLINNGVGMVKKWSATKDGRTRHSHRMVDGEIREYNETFSNGLMEPGDPNGRAEEVYNCRCTLLLIVKGFESSFVHEDPNIKGMTYQEWLEGKIITKEQYEKMKRR